MIAIQPLTLKQLCLEVRGRAGYWYLASPYSQYFLGKEVAFNEVSLMAARLITAGIPVFCPIAHSHSIAILGNISAVDHGVWMALDEHMMAGATGLIVAQLDGWDRSHGVGWEIGYMRAKSRPVHYLLPE